MALLTPILKAHNFDVEIVEANIDNLNRDQVKDLVREIAPDAVGISNMSLEYWRQAHLCAKLVKDVDQNITTIMGGVHPTTMPEKVMEDINLDYVVLSEGEERLPELLKALNTKDPDLSQQNGLCYRSNGKVIINQPVGWVHDLDALPFPDYKLFDWQKVMHTKQKSAIGLTVRNSPVGLVLTSRGCRLKCSFCAAPLISGSGVRLRSAESILSEIDMLVREYKIKELIFTDDEMYADRERCMKIFQGIKERNYGLTWKNLNLASWRMDREMLELMKETGCYQIIISPESGSNRVLKKIIHKPGNNKQILQVVEWCKELDIEVSAHFVIGFPGETWAEIRETMAFAEKLDVDQVKFAIATPFPGTELFQKAVEGGYLPADFNFYRDDTLGFASGFIETEHFTVNELHILRCYEWDRINFKTPEKIARYASMNGMTLEELEEFRSGTRRNVGLYFPDQAKKERESIDKVKRVANYESVTDKLEYSTIKSNLDNSIRMSS
ncbi:MAG: radical SAM protein [Magnetococcales bacterium]|nr:radical SAM protein [Magnetococcales bacterium]